jgi:hypothetical protein
VCISIHGTQEVHEVVDSNYSFTDKWPSQAVQRLLTPYGLPLPPSRARPRIQNVRNFHWLYTGCSAIHTGTASRRASAKAIAAPYKSLISCEMRALMFPTGSASK